MTSDSFRFSYIMDKPFAAADQYKEIDWVSGEVTPAMTIPPKSGGTPFTRHMLNGLGYVATIGTVMTEMGYPNGEIGADSIVSKWGGYPKGAIVRKITDDGYVYEYMSKVEDNVYALPDFAIPLLENEYWKPVMQVDHVFGAPNLEKVLAKGNEEYEVNGRLGSTRRITIRRNDGDTNFTESVYLTVTMQITYTSAGDGDQPGVLLAPPTFKIVQFPWGGTSEEGISYSKPITIYTLGGSTSPCDSYSGIVVLPKSWNNDELYGMEIDIVHDLDEFSVYANWYGKIQISYAVYALE